MPVEMRYDPEKRALYGVCISPMTLEETRDTIAELLESDRFPPNIRTLWDMREFDFRDMDRNFQELLISLRRQHPERGAARMALIVSDDYGFGTARMYETLSSDLPQELRVFRDYKEGEDWLLSEEP